MSSPLWLAFSRIVPILFQHSIANGPEYVGGSRRRLEAVPRAGASPRYNFVDLYQWKGARDVGALGARVPLQKKVRGHLFLCNRDFEV